MMEKPQKTGLFGGTFDPWTVAHQAIFEEVLNQNLVDWVVVLPTIVDYHRPGKHKWLSDIEKFKVICEFMKRSPFSDKVTLDFTEIRMKNSGVLSPERVASWRFIDTLERCSKLYGNSELYTIIGTDSLENFKTWSRWEDILKKGKLISVAGRNGKDPKTDIEHITLRIPEEFTNVSSTAIREKFCNVGEYMESVFGKEKRK